MSDAAPSQTAIMESVMENPLGSPMSGAATENAATPEAAPATIITSLTLESLRDSLQQAGYRVEPLTDPVANIQYLRSATGGLGFDIRPGNRLPGNDKSFADFVFVAVLQIAGDGGADALLEPANRWNVTRRFGRLQLSPPFLVFCLDISVINGVTPAHLRAQIELWDRLVQELLPYLRNELTKIGAARAAAQKPAVEETDDQQRKLIERPAPRPRILQS